MSAETSEKSYQMDSLKWLLVVLLIGGVVYGNYYFAAEPLLYRAVGIVVVVLLTAYVAAGTRKGENFIALAKGAQIEGRKVVWPTRQERNQTTLVVVLVVFVMALILWGLDSFFGWIASLIIG